MINARDALARLKEGNEKFVNGEFHMVDVRPPHEEGGAQPQKPFAIILGCSDSRVPAEIVFCQGLGDLFVIRVAGAIVAPSQIGSIEFAAEQFETRLVVVLGHSMCGAVMATIDQLRQPTEQRSPNLHAIVDRISPAVEPLLKNSTDLNHAQLVDRAVRSNIEASVQALRHGSQILEDLIAKNGLEIVGAEYCLDTGRVEFL